MKEIWQTIKQELDMWDKPVVPYNPVFAKKQKDIINVIDHYWASRYVEGDYDSLNFRKIFLNVVLNPTEVAQKLVDLDTKDIRFFTDNPDFYYILWFYETLFKRWLKYSENQFGQTFGQFLNAMVYNWPKYGHLLVKKAKGTVHIVPLQTVIVKQDARDFLSSPFLIEKHEYEPEELEATGWDNVKEVIDKYYKPGKRIKVYERIGWTKVSDKYNYFIVPEGVEDPNYILLYDKREKKDLYKELKWDDIPGRALGRGTVERLFESQIAVNQTENLFRKSLRWTSKQIFQTKDETIAKNLVTQIEDGDVIALNSEISKIPVEERNLHSYNYADVKWDRHIQDITFSYSQMAGERPPSGTPLGTSILQTQMAAQYYDLKREDFGLFLKKLIKDWIIPDFEKELKKEKRLLLQDLGEDRAEKIRNLILTQRVNNAIVKFVSQKMRVPTEEEVETIKSIQKALILKEKSLSLPPESFKNIEYEMDILITNEQVDTASRLTTLQTIFQILGSNPTVLRDKNIKRIFYKMIELAGFSPAELSEVEPPTVEERGLEEGAKVAGSMPRLASQPVQPEVLTKLKTL